MVRYRETDLLSETPLDSPETIADWIPEGGAVLAFPCGRMRMESARDADAPYTLIVVKSGPEVAFSVADLEVFRWRDDGESTGEVLTDGKIGLGQMAPFVGEQADLTAHRIEPV